jgi:hypothetical protein
MHKLLSRIYHRIAALIASDIRNVDARFTAIAAAFDERFLAIEKDFERSLIALRTSQQKSIAAEAAALHVRVNAVEAELRGTLAKHQVDATASATRIDKLESEHLEAKETLASFEAAAIYRMLEKHREAIQHLDATKRTAPNVKGGRPELLN